MRYLLGDVASLIGTSKEAIRYFEKKSILPQPDKTETGYREYDTNQAGILRWLRLYRGYGFSLSEAAELVQTQDPKSIQPILVQGVERLDEQIESLRSIRDNLAQFADEMNAAGDRLDEITFQENPAMYRISLDYREQMLVSRYKKANLRQWYDHMPLVKSMPLWHREDLEQGELYLDTGLGIPQCLVRGWNPMAQTGVLYYPARPCITWVMHTTPFDFNALLPAFTFLSHNGLKLDGDAFSQPVALFMVDGQPHYYHRFWFPCCPA